MSTQPQIVSSNLSSATSISIAATSSAVNPRRSENTNRRQETPVFSGSKDKNQGSDISNKDLYSLILQMKNQLDQQAKTGQMLAKELEDLKKSRNPANDTTPLIPRNLNFHTPENSVVHQSLVEPNLASGSLNQLPPSRSTIQFQQGSSMNPFSGYLPLPPQNNSPFYTQGTLSSQSVPIQNPMLTSYAPPIVSSNTINWTSTDTHIGDDIPMQTENAAPHAPSRMNPHNIGNPVSSQSYDANLFYVQDTGINAAVARELQNLKEMISSVPGVVRPIAEVPTESHKISRFTAGIRDVEIPKRFQTPTMKLYDGSTDPEEHVAHYRERMEVNHIPLHIKEACLCKGFGSTLKGPALKWLLSIPPNTISSFAHLINLFNNQFSCSRAFEKLTGDLYKVT